MKKQSNKTYGRLLKKYPIIGHLLRFLRWWFIFSGLYAIFAVCPFCGRVGCPVGAGSVGFVGGFLALCMQNWKAFVKLICSKSFKRNKKEH